MDALNPLFRSLDGVLFDKTLTTLIQYPSGKTGGYVMPLSVNKIQTSFAGGAFFMCRGLTEIEISKGLASIDFNTFAWCSNLKNVLIPEGVQNIGQQAFYSCSNLTNVKIPNSVTNIDANAFTFCTSLEHVSIPRGMLGIHPGAFERCPRLTEITVDPLNANYRSLDGVLFNKNLTTLVQFPGGKSGEYMVPNGVVRIDSSDFAGGAFRECTGLTSIIFPDTVNTIEKNAFNGCTGLTNLALGNGLTNIGTQAFFGCSSLTMVKVPQNVRNIGDQAFHTCASLRAIEVEPLNSEYSSVDGVLFNEDQTTLIQYPGGKIGAYKIPDNVSSISSSAFNYNESLKAISIGSGLQSISDYQFHGCTKLSTVSIPSNISSIGFGAFLGCTNLDRILIPASVTALADSAFSFCNNLKKIFFGGTVPKAGSFTFFETPSVTVYFAPGTDGWGPVFAGRPTEVWRPEVETSYTSLGVRNNQFGFDISWVGERSVVVEACNDLANPVWNPVATNRLSNGSSFFSDPKWKQFSTRIYRLRFQ